ncbi:MAG: hypothetical protein IJX62_01380 [Clostridia bacterium]|nr:hypothetical protein [Clostridia bacterium]MBQ9131109.1 hypothetical protein [Clostridia bacterium]
MKNISKASHEFDFQVPIEKFRFYWQRNVPATPFEIEVGEIYGSLSNDTFRLQIKKTPRGWQTFSDEYLSGTIDANGRAQCRFKRTLEAIIVTRLLPALMIAAMLFGCFVIEDASFVLLTIPAVGLCLCNFIRPTNRRQVLLGFLSHIAEQIKP